MRAIILFSTFFMIVASLRSQNPEAAERLVDDGVLLHDQGDYRGAILKYDAALGLDKDNLLALSEKAYSISSDGNYKECIKLCQKAIQTHPGEAGLRTVFVTMGNAYDNLGKIDESLKSYDEGITMFPTYYQLHFNKGITLAGVKRVDEAMPCFQHAVMLNANHPGSHNAIGSISMLSGMRVPALLAFCRFLSLESDSERAKQNLASVHTILQGDARQTGKNSVTINLDPAMLSQKDADGKQKENSFVTTDMIISLGSAIDFDEKHASETQVQRFIRKFESICGTLEETKKDNTGFFWEFYVPWFIEMKSRNLIEPFAYLIHSGSGEENVSRWISTHSAELDKFQAWSKAFAWKAE